MMQIVFETALFCLALITPALLASSFRSDSAAHAERGKTSTPHFSFESSTVSRWLGKRKAAI